MDTVRVLWIIVGQKRWIRESPRLIKLHEILKSKLSWETTPTYRVEYLDN